MIIYTIVLSCLFTIAKAEEPIKDSHNSIYTPKIKRIVNAINIGDYKTEDQYFDMLQTACNRNQCSPMEKQTIKSVGEQIVFCQVKHLKAHGIDNPDATNICQSQQAMLGCDTLATSLLRKMCYTGNKYSLRTWQEKELRFNRNRRLPASE